MSKSELNILRFLQGEATPEEMQKLQKWSAKKPENQKDLSAAQEVFNNVASLSDHHRVDADAEWSSFITSVKSKITDIELLQYADGTADYKLQKKVKDWAALNEANKHDLEVTMAVNGAMAGIDAHKSTNTTKQYQNHVKNRSSQITSATKTLASRAPAVVIEMPKASAPRSRSIIPMWANYAIAASVAVLIGIFLWKPVPTTVTFNTGGVHELSDGTIITLDENSTFTAFANVDKVDTREVQLTGTATFEIAKDPDKPFILTTEKGLGIDVLGTIFEISAHPEYLALISNIEGKIEAFDKEKPVVRAIINEGESMGFSKDGFVKINDEPDLRKSYTVSKVLDHLMENSNWKVSSGFANNFNLRSKVLVDLDLSYEEIIKALSEAGQLEYSSPRDGYYHITSFRGE